MDDAKPGYELTEAKLRETEFDSAVSFTPTDPKYQKSLKFTYPDLTLERKLFCLEDNTLGRACLLVLFLMLLVSRSYFVFKR